MSMIGEVVFQNIKQEGRGLLDETLRLEDIDDALEKNFEIFLGKFELQVSMLQIALERYIHLENDRVINAVTGAITQGPHTRIKDPVRFHEYVPGIAYSS